VTDFDRNRDHKPDLDLDQELGRAFEQVTSALRARPAPLQPSEVRMHANRRHRNRVIVFSAATALFVGVLGGTAFTVVNRAEAPGEEVGPVATGTPDPTRGTPPASSPSTSTAPSPADKSPADESPDTGGSRRSRFVVDGSSGPAGCGRRTRGTATRR
jgi:hypothetical protein